MHASCLAMSTVDIGSNASGVQECMGIVVDAIGVQGARDLWAPLMQLEGANARQLQWLAVLACW